MNWLAEAAETVFEHACPHMLWVYARPFPYFIWDRMAALGVAFAKVAASGRFHAVMKVEGEAIATTPGVPPE